MNQNLNSLYCSNNKIKTIPKLSPNLNTLYCSSNYLTFLPCLENGYLNYLYYDGNPIYRYNIINNYRLNVTIVKNKTFNKFRETYFIVKYRVKFIQWFLKSQREKIENKFSPNNLKKILDNVNDEDEEMFDKILENWK